MHGKAFDISYRGITRGLGGHDQRELRGGACRRDGTGGGCERERKRDGADPSGKPLGKPNDRKS